MTIITFLLHRRAQTLAGRKEDKGANGAAEIMAWARDGITSFGKKSCFSSAAKGTNFGNGACGFQVLSGRPRSFLTFSTFVRSRPEAPAR